RFDGWEFRLITGQPGTLSITQVLGLTVDAQGTLMVGLPERNLLRYSNGTFENTLQGLHPRELAITAIASGKDRTVLSSGVTNGTLRYSNGRFEALVPVTALPAERPSP